MACFFLSESLKTIDITPLPGFNSYQLLSDFPTQINSRQFCSMTIEALLMSLTLGLCLL